MPQTWGKGFNKKRSLTDILGPNAKHHPQIGTDIEIQSPDHYRQLLKEYDMEEAGDPQGGNKDWMAEKTERERNKPRHGRASVATDEQVRQATGRV
jgi:hypothetical protein